MTIEFNNSYPKRDKNGKMQDVFVYTVKGTAQELADYKKAKGDQYREDKETGKPLHFSLSYVGETCDLLITSNGNVVADNSKMRKAANLVGQYDFLKDQLAAQLLESLGINRSTTRNNNASTADNTVESKVEGVVGEDNAMDDPFKG
jgi:hypothetical protein